MTLGWIMALVTGGVVFWGVLQMSEEKTLSDGLKAFIFGILATFLVWFVFLKFLPAPVSQSSGITKLDTSSVNQFTLPTGLIVVLIVMATVAGVLVVQRVFGQLIGDYGEKPKRNNTSDPLVEKLKRGKSLRFSNDGELVEDQTEETQEKEDTENTESVDSHHATKT